MRRTQVYAHRSLRYLPLPAHVLWSGLARAFAAQALLYWQMPLVLEWHGRAVEGFLRLAGVPWTPGGEVAVLPGIRLALLETAALDYQQHPAWPWLFVAAAWALFWIGLRRAPAPLKPLLFLPPFFLSLTLLFFVTASPQLPYAPADFYALWCRGEAYLWLLLPLIFALGFLMPTIPLLHKALWLVLLLFFSALWSALRLGLALATFYYLGPLWMPLFYFAGGFLADFLCIVILYSLAMRRAAEFLAIRKEAWQG